MEDTIIALLNNNLRVIIPDFGAFIIRQKQPRIIVFNEFLRYNDGILIDFIVKTEGIDREIAEQRVADFAEDGSKLLASGREMIIEGLGSLKKDSSGKINFIEAPEIIEIEHKDEEPAEPGPAAVVEEKHETAQITEQEKPEKTGSRTTAVRKGKTVKAPAKVKSPRASKSSSKAVPSVVPQTVAETATIEPVPEIDKKGVETASPVETRTDLIPDSDNSADLEHRAAIDQAVMDPAINEPAINDPVTMETPPPWESPKPVEPAVNEPQYVEPAEIKPPQTFVPPPVPPKIVYPTQAPVPADKPPVISINQILALGVIFLFVNLGVVGWYHFRNKARHTAIVKPATTVISDTLDDRLADSVRAAALDSSIVYDEVPEAATPKQNAIAPGSRYYIVAGCFRDEVNADSLVVSLKHLGYNAEKFGKIGNLFAVCYASFDNKDKAVDELKKIREKIPSAWMTKF